MFVKIVYYKKTMHGLKRFWHLNECTFSLHSSTDYLKFPCISSSLGPLGEGIADKVGCQLNHEVLFLEWDNPIVQFLPIKEDGI